MRHHVRRWRLIRILMRNIRFLVVVLGGLLFGTDAVLAVVRIWNVAPPGSEQKVRISVVDLVQAWNLSRTARRLESAGDDEGALRCWGTAIANHPTRPELSRSYIETALRLPDQRDRLHRAAGQLDPLLRLSGTNANGSDALQSGNFMGSRTRRLPREASSSKRRWAAPVGSWPTASSCRRRGCAGMRLPPRMPSSGSWISKPTAPRISSDSGACWRRWVAPPRPGLSSKRIPAAPRPSVKPSTSSTWRKQPVWRAWPKCCHDAVAFGHRRVNVPPGGDFHPAIWAPSQAHERGLQSAPVMRTRSDGSFRPGADRPAGLRSKGAPRWIPGPRRRSGCHTSGTRWFRVRSQRSLISLLPRETAPPHADLGAGALHEFAVNPAPFRTWGHRREPTPAHLVKGGLPFARHQAGPLDQFLVCT